MTWRTTRRPGRRSSGSCGSASCRRSARAGPIARPTTAPIEWLESQLDAAAAAHPNPGRPVLHRLNRAEYANAIRDLLGLDVDVSSLLPPDDAAYGFDNVADALGSSPALLQAYLVGRAEDQRRGRRRPAPRRRQRHLLGPAGSVAGPAPRRPAARHVRRHAARHTFPLDGEYDFQVRLYRTNLSAMRGPPGPPSGRADARRRARAARRVRRPRRSRARCRRTRPTHPTRSKRSGCACASSSRPAGTTLVAAFLDEAPRLLATSRLQPFLRDFDNPFAAEGAPHVQSITRPGTVQREGARQRAEPARVPLPPGANATEPTRRPVPRGSSRRWRAGPTAGRVSNAEVDRLCSRSTSRNGRAGASRPASSSRCGASSPARRSSSGRSASRRASRPARRTA